MCIDIPIGFVFTVEIIQNQPQSEMFQYIGMIAGMKSMSVTEHSLVLNLESKCLSESVLHVFRQAYWS